MMGLDADSIVLVLAFIGGLITVWVNLNSRLTLLEARLDFGGEKFNAIDKLVEVYQGAFSLIGTIPAPKVTERDVLKLLEADAEWIEENHESICKGNRAVANLIDGVTEVYLTTVYKLRNLK